MSESIAILRLLNEAEEAIQLCGWCGQRGHVIDQCHDLTLYLRRQAETQCEELGRIRHIIFWTGMCLGGFLGVIVGRMWV